MTPRQIELARHALGLPTSSGWSYRNYFTAGAGHTDFVDWYEMVAAGDALVRGPNDVLGGDFVFRLTAAGAEQALKPGEKLDPEDFPRVQP